MLVHAKSKSYEATIRIRAIDRTAEKVYVLAHWSSMYNIRSKQCAGRTNGEKQDHISIPQTWNHNTNRPASKWKGIALRLQRTIILE